MHYEGDIYRPPSEAYSLIVQVTVGCTHNSCTFCSAYRADQFKIKPFDIVLADLLEARSCYRRVERIFLADGDAFCMTVSELTRLLDTIREIFPECERVGIYSRASQILCKSDDELIMLRKLGLGIIYIGAESGSDEVRRRVCKDESAKDIIEAVQKAERAGINTSVTFISGLGGRELMAEHAAKSGEMISVMGASYAAFISLDLELDSRAPLYAQVQSGEFQLLTPPEVIEELEIILEHIDCSGETVFRSNHASNWLMLKGTLPHDRGRMLEQIRFAKAKMAEWQ